MIIIRPDQQVGLTHKLGSQFSGTVTPHLVLAPTDGIVVNSVNFAPGARTFWHEHEYGQLLQITAGRGRVQSAGGPIERLFVGDTVWVPPTERHWHGADTDSYLVHTAISLGTTRWYDEVIEDR